MATELTEDSTHEDIQNAVDQIVEEERKSDEAPVEELKGDGQAIAEEQDESLLQTAETDDSGSEEAAPEGEDTGQDDWLTDDLKAEIAAYGIDEEELADFTSREELERALRVFDKTALEAGRKAMADGEERSRDERGRYAEKPKPEKEEPKEGKTGHSAESRYEIQLDKDVYDEDLVGELTRMRDHYEDRVGALESRFAEADARVEEERFDTLVDSLSHADLFGKSGKESKKELERRQDLFVAVKAQQIGLEQLGRQTDLDQSLVNRVARMVFADELGKKELKARTKKMSKQSQGRGGDSATKGLNPEESLDEWAARRYKELEALG